MSGRDIQTSRTEWATRFGFLMAMIGAMVGVGNIWRFPFVTGENGGGAFILAFLILLFIVLIPGLIAEVGLGRYAGKGVIGSIREATGPNAAAGLGVIVLVVNIALLSYYYPVVGWTLYYAGHAFLFTFTSSGFEAGAFLDSFFNSPATMFAMHSAVALIVGIVLYFGIQRGVERLVVFAMPVLLFTLLVIAIRAVTLDGAAEGLAFTFTVEWEYLTYTDTWLEALAQALFSAGLGWGIAITVGSYLRKYDDAPLGGGVFTAVGEASIGVLAAFVIFPLVFAFGADPADGAGLTFEAMPQVFGEMPAGELWAILFFAGFFIAAITSAVVLSEVGVTAIKEETGLSRAQSVTAVCGGIWLLGIPSAYSVEILEFGDDLFALWGLPLASIAITVAVGWFLGPERLRVLSINQNTGIYIGKWWNTVVKYVVPTVMAVIMIVFAIDHFGDRLMIAGVAMVILVPLFSFLLMKYVGDKQRPQQSLSAGGDD